MKKALYAFLLTMLLASCGTTLYQLNSDCPNKTTEDVFKNLVALLMNEGFTIRKSEIALGYLEAGSAADFNVWKGASGAKTWVFQIKDGKIIASAKIVDQYIDSNGAVTNTKAKYFNDETSSDEAWYWNIRNGLERICGSKVVITEKEL